MNGYTFSEVCDSVVDFRELRRDADVFSENIVIAGSTTLNGIDAMSVDTVALESSYIIEVYDDTNGVVYGTATINLGDDLSVAGNWTSFSSDVGLTASQLASNFVALSKLDSTGSNLVSFDKRTFRASTIVGLPYNESIRYRFTSTTSEVSDSLTINDATNSMDAVYATTSPSESVTIPISGTYAVQIDWGDGSVTRGTTIGILTHTYSVAGNYTVRILGGASAFAFNNGGDRLKLNSVTQWGDLEVNSAVGLFYGCNNLTSLPSGAITGFDSVTSLTNGFRDCNLSTIPTGLLDNLTSLTNVASLFENNTLITSVPTGLLDNNTLLTTVSRLFLNTSLTSIPASLFTLNTQITSFRQTFQQTDIASIPASLFATNTLATDFQSCFLLTLLTAIPAGLFDTNTLVTNFKATFRQTSITSIPANLFANCSVASDFSETFLGCTSLLAVYGDFSLNTNVTTFSFCYSACSSISSASGEYWLLSGISGYNLTAPDYNQSTPNGFGCYRDCTLISDVATIPTYWK